MRAFKENPIITLACRNFVTQYATSTTKALSWTAINPNLTSGSLGTKVSWGGSWSTFVSSAFPEGTIFEAKKADFPEGYEATCIFLDGTDLYKNTAAGITNVYYIVEISEGALLVAHKISKIGDNYIHSFEDNVDSSEELLDALVSVLYDKTSEGGDYSATQLHGILSGSLGINADLNEDSSKVDVHPDMTNAENGYVWSIKTVTPEVGDPYKTAYWSTIEDALQAQSTDQGKFLKLGTAGIMWATPSGGTQLYKHNVVISSYKFVIITNRQNAYGSSNDIFNDCGNIVQVYEITGDSNLLKSVSIYQETGPIVIGTHEIYMESVTSDTVTPL